MAHRAKGSSKPKSKSNRAHSSGSLTSTQTRDVQNRQDEPQDSYYTVQREWSNVGTSERNTVETGQGVWSGGSASAVSNPTMQHWMGESMSEQPYNNLGQFAEMNYSQNPEARSFDATDNGTADGTAGSAFSGNSEIRK